MQMVTALRLGRVSNLPTVWSNVLAGVALSGADPLSASTPALLLSLSLFYVAGMYLNDAFDADYDRRFRPERPIPSGEVTSTLVFALGFALLAGGWALLFLASIPSLATPAAGAALAAAILIYDAWHKGNPISPLLMGLCRLLAYVSAGYAVTNAPPAGLWIAAGASLCYLIGLTYAAKQESLLRLTSLWPLLFLAVPLVWGAVAVPTAPAVLLPLIALAAWAVHAVRLLLVGGAAIPRAVVALIAGISLVDATFVAATGHLIAAALCVGAFALTLRLQRQIAGT
jgi:4-hydroxybenzoate polyprenyltransferase